VALASGAGSDDPDKIVMRFPQQRLSHREMEQKAIDILNGHRLMAISTLRPDGWPQTTMVSYANDGLLLYFVVSRTSQKFSNIERDSRVSIAVGRDFEDPAQIRALSIAANASEIRDPNQRDRALDLIRERHPALARLGSPDTSRSAVMRAYCSIVTILDYSKGFGHADSLTVSPGGTEMAPARDDDWGFSAPRQRSADD
jgi:nitroimidazol reductase NimA-like FMN-containing flavoprotein (pyridoxamine 5'-phosphate oxidase superfamily)